MAVTVPSKDFSPELHEEYDKPAKAAVALFFQEQGHNARLDPYGKYDVDLAVDLQDGTMIHVEVEVRPDCWDKDGDWKYDTVHIPERKSKFLNRERLYVFSLNADFTKAIVVSDAVIARYQKVHVRNKYVTEGELFYDIPLNEAYYRSLIPGAEKPPAPVVKARYDCDLCGFEHYNLDVYRKWIQDGEPILRRGRDTLSHRQLVRYQKIVDNHRRKRRIHSAEDIYSGAGLRKGRKKEYTYDDREAEPEPDYRQEDLL